MTVLSSHIVALALALNAGVSLGSEIQPGRHASAYTNAGLEEEYRTLQAQDEAAQRDIQKWREESTAKGAGISQAELDRRINQSLDAIEKAYLDFLRRHPDHARARLSYGCFLDERKNEAGAQVQWEKALELDPRNPDAYNNLAGRYSEVGPSQKAFEFYTRAIELNPSNAVYYHNFADTLYVLRNHAMTNYHLTEQQVFTKAVQLYSNAWRLEPTNFSFAWDWGQTYYALKPLPYDEALKAWTNALGSAQSELGREDAYLHLARLKMLAGRLAEAQAQLVPVTNASRAESKAALLRGIAARQRPEEGAGKTNRPPEKR